MTNRNDNDDESLGLFIIGFLAACIMTYALILFALHFNQILTDVATLSGLQSAYLQYNTLHSMTQTFYEILFNIAIFSAAAFCLDWTANKQKKYYRATPPIEVNR